VTLSAIVTPGAVMAARAGAGLSGIDVGQMYVSMHTVAFHMRQIFRKLGIGSRVEFARIVIQRNGQRPPPRSAR
jgi:hypothetical protein